MKTPQIPPQPLLAVLNSVGKHSALENSKALVTEYVMNVQQQYYVRLFHPCIESEQFVLSRDKNSLEILFLELNHLLYKFDFVYLLNGCLHLIFTMENLCLLSTRTHAF